MRDERLEEELSNRLRQRLANALKGTPGVGTPYVTVVSGAKAVSIQVNLEGWSPSLHAARVRNECALTLHDPAGARRDAAAFEADVARMHDAIALRQRERAEHAAELGYRTHASKREVSHLQVDRSLAELRGETPQEARKAVVEAVVRAHASSIEYSGGPVLHAGGVLIGEQRLEDGRWMRIAAPNVKLRFDDGRRLATLRGFELDIEAPNLPDTVLAALVGRPLGDLASIHPALDRRTVRKAANRTHKARPGLLVTIDLEVDPIDEVLTDLPKAA